MEKIENMECAMLGGGMSHCSIEFPLNMYVHEYVPSVGRTIPKMAYYNGKGDLYKHVTQLERQMRLAGHYEITMCQRFT